MSMIPEVKCRRCGETFSSLRSRCPNCGTRRVAQSGRTPGTTPGTVKGTASYERAETNTKWQMIFGLILVVAVILAVIVMVSTSLNGADQGTGPKNTVAPVVSAAPTIEAPPTPVPTPTPNIEKIEVKYGNSVKNDGPDSWPLMHVGEVLTYDAVIYPMSLTGLTCTWSVDDESIFTLTPKENNSCEIECLKSKAGGAKITVECCGMTTSFTIYAAD